MQRREYLLATTGIVATTSIGAVAYTNAEVSRDITIDIAEDNTAIIGLSPGTTNAVSLQSGVLTIDTSTEDSEGLNPDGTFDYGDTDAPTSEYAFSLSNNDTDERTFTISLEDFTFGGSAVFTLHLYESDGSLIGEATPGSSQAITLTGADTAYAVIEVNTDGLTDSDDMSGTLNISAE